MNRNYFFVFKGLVDLLRRNCKVTEMDFSKRKDEIHGSLNKGFLEFQDLTKLNLRGADVAGEDQNNLMLGIERRISLDYLEVVKTPIDTDLFHLRRLTFIISSKQQYQISVGFWPRLR